MYDGRMGARYMQVFEGYLVLDTVEVRCCCCGEVLGFGRYSVQCDLCESWGCAP